jgi:hypothetical protein
MKRRLARHWPLLLLGLAIVLVAALAFARPGGGESYSGGGSSGGGGGGGGGDDSDSSGAIIALVILCFEHPVIGIPLLTLFVIFLIVKAKMKGSGNSWATSNYAQRAYVPPQPPVQRAQSFAVTRTMLDRIRSVDPEFSVVLFEDFLYTLYGEVHRFRARGNIASLAAYVSPSALGALAQDPSLGEVRGVVIGAMRYLALRGMTPGQPTTIEIEFEANYSEVRQQGEQRLYVVERMVLSRGADAKSRPPARSRTLDCPNCGAPLQNVRGDQCSYCKQQVGGGRFDWAVTSLYRTRTEHRGPLLTSNVAEVGNDLPTIVDPQAGARVDQLRAKDPTFDWNQLQARTALVFQQLQVAWSTREWLRARPFVTDNLFQSQMYWIDLYIQARARNVTENARIVRIDLASVISDKHYDAITVRVWATSLDYTISDDGKLLSGSRSKERAYSEYWTLIRGARPTGKPTRTTPECPSCGAPLKIAMTGNCEYCKVKVTTGDFDWVLSRIEQDESYAG